MWNLLWPMLMVVGANTVYNICAKSTPEKLNSFARTSKVWKLHTTIHRGCSDWGR